MHLCFVARKLHYQSERKIKMSKAPLVKPLSKAAVGSRLSFILSIFKFLTFDLAAFFVSKAAEAKEGLWKSKDNARE